MTETIMPKDFHETNVLIRWSILIGVVFFIVLAYFIWVVEFDIFRNPTIVTDNHLRYGLLVIALFLTVQIIRVVNKGFAQYINRSYQSRFKHIKDFNTYVESKEKTFFTEKKYDHVVLLLHGFSASPQEFQFLLPHLKAHGINYYVPNLMGFGLDNTALLNNTRRQDWYRTCIGIYDALSQISNKVSVIGHSMGAVLASYIASNRHIHQLILTAPGFFPRQSYRKYKFLLTTPILSSIYITLIPYLPKPFQEERGYLSDILDSEVAKRSFHYLAIPVSSVREVLLMQDETRLNKMSFDNLSVIYGQHEMTIDMQKMFRALDTHKVTYQSYCLKNSAHNILEDFDREECCKLITDLLLDNNPQ